MNSETNDSIQNIYSLIKLKKNIFITGKAGTGKTTLLKEIYNEHKDECVVVAPTGVAAINAGGVTIHSLFSLPIGVQEPDKHFDWKLPSNKSAIIKKMKILIIDEISMVRCDLLDAIDRRLRITKKSKLPFGGVQIIMFGDLLQLPPVVTNDEESVLSEYYDNFYFFNSLVWKNSEFKMIELQEIFRQTDQEFISLLSDVRNCNLSESSKLLIDKMLHNKQDYNNTINLCALRKIAESINEKKLGNPTFIFKANITGEFNSKNAICDTELKLRLGARVMITKNDTQTKLYCNGTLGVVKEITNNYIKVLTDEGYNVVITPEKIESYKYEVKTETDENGNINKVINKLTTGSCTQFPLTLAYAITIHKSQGLTFNNVALHIKEVFQSGQLYTALSRCRTADGVTIDNPITNDMLKKNQSIDNFIDTIHNNDNYYGYVKD